MSILAANGSTSRHKKQRRSRNALLQVKSPSGPRSVLKLLETRHRSHGIQRYDCSERLPQCPHILLFISRRGVMAKSATAAMLLTLLRYQDVTKGSTTAFVALHRAMINKNKIAVVRFSPRRVCECVGWCWIGVGLV